MTVRRYLEMHGLLRPLSGRTIGHFVECPLKVFLALSAIGLLQGIWWGLDHDGAVTLFYSGRWVILGGLAMALGLLFEALGLLWVRWQRPLLHIAIVLTALLSCVLLASTFLPLSELLYPPIHWVAPGPVTLAIPPLGAAIAAWRYLRPPPSSDGSLLGTDRSV